MTSRTVHRAMLSINVRWWNAEAAYALNLARGLSAQGIEVYLIANPGSPAHQKAELLGFKVITGILLDSRSPLTHIRNLVILLRLIDREGIELINSFKSNGSFLFTVIRRLRPHVTYIKTRGVATPPKQHAINRYLYGEKSCDGLITVGSPVYRWMKGLLGASSRQQIETIYYGDSPVAVSEAESTEAMANDLQIPDDRTVFALLGRTQRLKGHFVLLEALNLLRSKAIHCLFLVKDLDEFPDVLDELRSTIKQYDLSEQVTILGFQESLGPVLSRVDCGVIPSLSSEVNCRVCVEFFSAGIPVIAFPTGSLPDLVSHMKNGYLCAEKTASALSQALRWALEDVESFKTAGRQAFADFQRYYTLEVMALQTIRFYESCKKSNLDH